MLAPRDSLPHAKCGICNKYLSFFPIYISNEKLPICGRCKEHLTENNSYVRDKPYESLAEFLKFPCIYNVEGCLENLFPPDVPAHEKSCPYRIICCPLDCMWQGTVNDLLQHFEEMHPGAILRNGEFELDVLSSYEAYSIVTYNDEIFNFKRKFDPETKTLECSVFCFKSLDPVTNYKYKVVVQNGPRSLSVQFAPKSAEDFQEENVSYINADEVKTQLQDPSIIIGTVFIFTETENEETPQKKAKKIIPEINYEMLRELECPVCMDYIAPPIFQCVTGHSICSECKTKVKECPTCKGEIKNTQNFTLEKMAYFLTYPCKYTDYGCDFASKPGKIKQHQKYCLHGPHHCPLRDYENCIWKDSAKNIYSHVEKVHHDNILEIDTIHSFVDNNYFNTEDSNCYVMKFSDKLFKLHYLYKQNAFYWAMQLIGPPEEATLYQFEIDVVDNNNTNQRMFLRKVCSPFTEKNEAFGVEGSYAFVRLEQIRSFLTDVLSYRVRIMK